MTRRHLRPLLHGAGLTLGALLLGMLGSLALWCCWPARMPGFQNVRAAYTSSDAWLLDREGEPLDSVRITHRVRRLQWVPLEQVSPALVSAILSGEDRDFWTHRGVDLRNVAGALRDQLLYHRRRGASTLSMQLAAMLQGRHATTGLDAWVRKLQQVRGARALERAWSKAQILEAYLNLLDYRGELQGVAAASWQLAGKTPAGLTLSESAALAALLPQPNASEPALIRRACARALALHPAPPCESVRAAVVSMARRTPPPSPGLAPQLAHALLVRPGQQLRTSLDGRLQRIAVRVLHEHLLQLADHNARDGAALIIDNASGEVLAYVGSGGPLSRSPLVDGVRAPRQAGSTLKPFLYELALERRYLTASSLLLDAPLSLQTANGVYLPQDYDHDFKGLTSVRTALASSLNVPAVRTLVLTGIDAFRSRLLALGYDHITGDDAFYGYSLALGSAEVSLWEQAQAYHALARGGQWSSLQLTRGTTGVSKALLDPGATFIIADILSDPAARALTFGLDNHLITGFWAAVKTGTSEDMRDNWCVGFSRDFTVAVWVGNFEGDSMRDVSGVSGAAPIWHDLMIAAQGERPALPAAAPAGVTAHTARFARGIEPARREWYLAGAGNHNLVAAVPDQDRPGIEAPANATIIALDPDIPPDSQRLLISLRGVRPGMTLALNDQALGSASAQQLWSPRPGAWDLKLVDRSGRTLDQVSFTVRAAPL